MVRNGTLEKHHHPIPITDSFVLRAHIQNNWLIYLLIGIFVLVVFQLISAGVKEGGVWRDRMIALTIMMVINIIFWAAFEQAGTSLTLFAKGKCKPYGRLAGKCRNHDTVL